MIAALTLTRLGLLCDRGVEKDATDLAGTETGDFKFGPSPVDRYRVHVPRQCCRGRSPPKLLGRIPPRGSPVSRIQSGVLPARRALASGECTRFDSGAGVRGVPRYLDRAVDDDIHNDGGDDDKANVDAANSDDANSDDANSDDANLDDAKSDDANDSANGSGRAARRRSHRGFDA